MLNDSNFSRSIFGEEKRWVFFFFSQVWSIRSLRPGWSIGSYCWNLVLELSWEKKLLIECNLLTSIVSWNNFFLTEKHRTAFILSLPTHHFCGDFVKLTCFILKRRSFFNTLIFFISSLSIRNKQFCSHASLIFFFNTWKLDPSSCPVLVNVDVSFI